MICFLAFLVEKQEIKFILKQARQAIWSGKNTIIEKAHMSKGHSFEDWKINKI